MIVITSALLENKVKASANNPINVTIKGRVDPDLSNICPDYFVYFFLNKAVMSHMQAMEYKIGAKEI